MAAQNFMAIHQVVVEIFSGWTKAVNQPINRPDIAIHIAVPLEWPKSTMAQQKVKKNLYLEGN